MITAVQSATAAARLAAARQFLAALPADGEALLVGATRAAVDDLVRDVAATRPATVGLHRFTLTQLAARLAAPQLAERGLAPCSPLGAHAVAARAAFDALAAGALHFCAPVAAMPGFTRTLAATLSELRAEGISAAALAAAPAPADELAGVLERYDARLAAAGLADRAALFAAATAAVAARGDPLLGLPLLLLDLPLASRRETDFARALAGAAGPVLVTIPAGDDAIRHWTTEITGRPSGPATETAGEDSAQPVLPFGAGAAAPPGAGHPAGALQRLQTYLFAEADPPAAEADDSVCLFSAPGEGREAVEIARRIVAEARAGTPFDRMAVFLRSPETHAALLEAAFRRAGVPAWFARGTRRPNPSGRAFLALLACAAERLSALRFAEYLSLGQVPRGPDAAAWAAPRDEAMPGAPDGDDPAATAAPAEAAPAAPWRWESLLTDAAVIGGAARWARRLDGLAHELETRRAALEQDDPDAPGLAGLARSRAELARLRAFALPLVDRLAALPVSAAWGEWLQHLAALAGAALEAPAGVRAVLAELAPMAAVGPVGLEEVRDVLADRLATLADDPPASRYGRVLVAAIDDARGREAEVVFLPGLAERLFPQRPREDPLLLDAARVAVDAALTTQTGRGGRERLRLRLAVGAATRRLVLSYPRADVSQGRSRVISFYGLDVARAMLGGIPDVEAYERRAAAVGTARLAWPAPPDAADAIDAAEHDLATVAALIHAAPDQRPAGGAQYLLELNPHLGRSLRARYARWEQRRWSPLDGLTRTTPATAPLLAAQRLTARPYSPSALQHFARCPYRFFLAAIQRLAPRTEAAPLEQLDPLTRGSLVHQVQAATLRALAAAGALPLTHETVAAAEPVLIAALERIAAETAEALAPPIPRVWQEEVGALRGDLVTWLRRLAARGPSWQPAFVEFAFGLPADGARDPASSAEPARLGDGLLLRGAVDLVERRADGTLRVVDHKTGADRTAPGLVVGHGEVLQPTLYGLAVEAVLGAPVEDGRLSFCTARGGFGERVVPLDDRARASALAVLRQIDAAIAAGHFHPAPREGACAPCEFRPVCGPYEEERVGRKEALPDLAALRRCP